jgi:hypothetical protein
MMKRATAFVAFMAACSFSLTAQWPKYQEQDIPRDAGGHIRMDAPTPRTSAGKPDFTGNWVSTRNAPQGSSSPADAKSPPLANFMDVGTNFPGGLPLTPWAAELKKERLASRSKDNPDANCLPAGIMQQHGYPLPRKMIQTPKLILITYEGAGGMRYIHTDGRPLPPQGDPQPWWDGYSVGHWEGDTLVVETNNLRGAESGKNNGWLDKSTPYSDQAKFIERYRRPVFGRVEIDVTLEDPKAYTKPFTVRFNQRYLPDEELMESVCNENQQFGNRIKVE